MINTNEREVSIHQNRNGDRAPGSRCRSAGGPTLLPGAAGCRWWSLDRVVASGDRSTHHPWMRGRHEPSKCWPDPASPSPSLSTSPVWASTSRGDAQRPFSAARQRAMQARLQLSSSHVTRAWIHPASPAIHASPASAGAAPLAELPVGLLRRSRHPAFYYSFFLLRMQF